MICIDDCPTCKHRRPLKDGWRFACDAFPDGAPKDFPFGKVKELKECNNGIGYEPKEELQDWKEKMSEPVKFKRITEEEYKQLKEAGKLN